MAKTQLEITNASIDAAFRMSQEGQPVGALATLARTRLNLDAASKVKRIVRAFDGALKDYQTHLGELLAPHGGSIKPGAEGWSEFVPQYNELLAVRVPVECEVLTRDELWCRENGQRAPIDVEPGHLELLEEMGVLAQEADA